MHGAWTEDDLETARWHPRKRKPKRMRRSSAPAPRHPVLLAASGRSLDRKAIVGLRVLALCVIAAGAVACDPAPSEDDASDTDASDMGPSTERGACERVSYITESSISSEPQPGAAESWTCYDDWVAFACDDGFHPGQTCAEIGYDNACENFSTADSGCNPIEPHPRPGPGSDSSASGADSATTASDSAGPAPDSDGGTAGGDPTAGSCETEGEVGVCGDCTYVILQPFVHPDHDHYWQIWFLDPDCPAGPRCGVPDLFYETKPSHDLACLKCDELAGADVCEWSDDPFYTCNYDFSCL